MIASHMSLCNQDSFILLVSSGYAVGQSDFADRPNITLVKGLMLKSFGQGTLRQQLAEIVHMAPS